MNCGTDRCPVRIAQQCHGRLAPLHDTEDRQFDFTEIDVG